MRQSSRRIIDEMEQKKTYCSFFRKALACLAKVVCVRAACSQHSAPRLLPAADMPRNQPSSIMHPGEWKVLFCNHYYSSQSTQIETSKIHRIIYVKDGKDALGSWILSPVVQTAEIMIILDPDSTLRLPHGRGSTECLHIIV